MLLGSSLPGALGPSGGPPGGPMILGPSCLLGPNRLLGAAIEPPMEITNPQATIRGYGHLMTLKAGDRAPDLIIDLTSDAGPVDLTEAVSIRILGTRDGITTIDRAGYGTDQGRVSMGWQPADTTVGITGFEVEVTWVGGKAQTFPNRGLLWVSFAPDLG